MVFFCAYNCRVYILRCNRTLSEHVSFKNGSRCQPYSAQLVIKFWNADDAENPMDTPVQVLVDGGILKEVKAGEELVVPPGDSVTLAPRVYYEFSGRGGNVLIGEVSSINDDTKDNRFLEPLPRFSSIEEDEPILYYLCNEYP